MEYDYDNETGTHHARVHHMRVSLTTSFVTSIVVGFFSAGVTWGITGSRIIALEERAKSAEVKVALLENRATDLKIETEVTNARYNEILRRLEKIEAKL